MKINVMSRMQYTDYLIECGDSITNYPEYEKAELFMFSDNEDNPYIVVQYMDESVWIYGLRVDRQCESLGAAFEILIQGE